MKDYLSQQTAFQKHVSTSDPPFVKGWIMLKKKQKTNTTIVVSFYDPFYIFTSETFPSCYISMNSREMQEARRKESDSSWIIDKTR